MKKVFIAIPAYTGGVDWQCADALINNIRELEKAGYSVTVYWHPGCLYIDQVRCLCVKKFLESDCDEMIFVDSDLWFEPLAMCKLLEHNKELIAGAYPFKNNSGYPVYVLPDPAFDYHTPFVDSETRLIKVQIAPTGLMKISRSVFDKMIVKHPEWKANDKVNGDYYLFFDCGRHRENDLQWYGEDVQFCLRWQDMGGETWIRPDIDFKHIGKMEAAGNYHKFLLTMPRMEAIAA